MDLKKRALRNAATILQLGHLRNVLLELPAENRYARIIANRITLIV